MTTIRIELDDEPLRLELEDVKMWLLEFTLGDVGVISAYLTKKTLGGLPDPDLATATITFDLWGYVDGVDTHILDSLACTLTDADTGLVEVSLPVGGIVYEGDNFRGRFNVQYLDGRVESYPRGRQQITVLVRRA
jgi:hypothetical protein